MNQTAVIIIVAVAVIVIVYLMMNRQSAQRQADVSSQIENNVLTPCVPFTQKQQDDALRILRSKCAAQLLIPVVGIGAYNTCMAKGRASIPEVKNC